MRETYLDGLRGWASLFVLLGHLGPVFLLVGQNFPPIPFFIDARLAVFVFFALSGYVLSIHFYRTGDRVSVVSLALRRYFRLTIPIAASIMIAVIIDRLGLALNQQAGTAAGSPWLSLGFQAPIGLAEAAKFALVDVYRLGVRDALYYNAVLWTMPYEMLGSFLIFGILLATGRSVQVQVTATLSFCIASWWADSFLLPFGFGMALALFRSWYNHRPSFAANGLLLLAMLAVLGGAALRYPVDNTRSLSVYAAAIVAICTCSPQVQRFLDWPISQWLGRISFPLYLVHLFAIYTVGSALYLWLGGGAKVSSWGAAVVAVASVMSALAFAWAFQPVERLSVLAGRTFSQRLLRPRGLLL